jgi:transaldolase
MATLALSYTDEFMCHAWGANAQELYDCGLALTKPDPDRIVVKVPVTITGVEAASMLIKANCRVCLTACYDHKQAMIAANVGAEYIATYLGRMTDAEKDGAGECCKMQEIVTGLQAETRVLVASIRDYQTLVDLSAKGIDTFTISPSVARELFEEPLTDYAAAEFEAAASRNH